MKYRIGDTLQVRYAKSFVPWEVDADNAKSVMITPENAAELSVRLGIDIEGLDSAL